MHIHPFVYPKFGSSQSKNNSGDHKLITLQGISLAGSNQIAHLQAHRVGQTPFLNLGDHADIYAPGIILIEKESAGFREMTPYLRSGYNDRGWLYHRPELNRGWVVPKQALLEFDDEWGKQARLDGFAGGLPRERFEGLYRYLIQSIKEYKYSARTGEVPPSIEEQLNEPGIKQFVQDRAKNCPEKSVETLGWHVDTEEALEALMTFLKENARKIADIPPKSPGDM